MTNDNAKKAAIVVLATVTYHHANAAPINTTIFSAQGDCVYSNSNRAILGSTKVGDGYNVVYNSDSGGTYPLLNTYSFDQKGAILLSYVVPGSTDGPVSECFNVPDAFFTSYEAMGVDPTQAGWDMSFSSEAGYSARSLQQEMASSNEKSYSGSVSYLSVASAESAYTKSDSISSMTSDESTQSTNSIHMYSSGAFYGLNLLNPNPTERAVQAWLDLNSKGENDQQAFDVYFDTFGTHFFKTGIMGGNLMIEVTASASTSENGQSQAKDQGNCLSAKASTKFWGVSAGAATEICKKSSAVSNASASFEQLYQKCYVQCQGGVCNGSNNVCGATDSDNPEESKKAFTDWQVSVFTSPSVLPGRSTYDWVTALLSSNYASKAGVVERFGGQENYDAFTQVMQERLKDYLTNNNYCSVYNNCGGAELQYVKYIAPWNTPTNSSTNFLSVGSDGNVFFMMETPVYKDIMVPINTFFHLPTSNKLVNYDTTLCLGANPTTNEVKAVTCVWNGDNFGNVVNEDGFVQSGWTFAQNQLRLANRNLCLVTAVWDTSNKKQLLDVKLDTCSLADRSKLSIHHANDGTFGKYLHQYTQNVSIGDSYPWIPNSVSIF